jgi:hypothetical protein
MMMTTTMTMISMMTTTMTTPMMLTKRTAKWLSIVMKEEGGVDSIAGVAEVLRDASSVTEGVSSAGAMLMM